MKKLNFILIRLAVFLLCSSMGFTLSAQTTITGNVTDAAKNEPYVGATIRVKGTMVGTQSDFDGNFTLELDQQPPFTIVVSAVGMKTQELEVTDAGEALSIPMEEESTMADAVVIGASKVEEKVIESPVSIEKMDAKQIAQSPTADFYDGLSQMKGVQLTSSSMTFQSINTRGFATIANVRFVQIVDGMDNSAPGLNFPMGNLVGASELDVASVELIPGAASALYGPNAFNGILFINSKNPFLSTGLSAYVKGGFTRHDVAGNNPFGNLGIRYAGTAFKQKLGYKFNFSAFRATDWNAADYTDNDKNIVNEIVRGTDNFDNKNNSPSYDGINVYGDEIAVTIDLDRALGLPAGTNGLIRPARTGYKEVDLMDYGTQTYKADAALHYRLTDKMELSYTYRFGTGTSIYQGANRYSLKDFMINQHKVELKADNFYVRGYATLENAGKSYDSRFLAWNINRAWKADSTWFKQYTQNYVLGLFQGETAAQAHARGRAAADAGRILPGSDEFNRVRNELAEKADLATGARFIDRTKLFHIEGQYDFKNEIKFLDVQVGGNYRQYLLNSEGTIFNDKAGKIPIHEVGAYVQASKRLLEDRLKLTASARFDKNSNFQGRITPRVTAVYSAGENREHNIRASYQTGFRNPDTQSQYIGLDLGVATLVGGSQDNIDNYSVQRTYTDDAGNLVPVTIKGRDLYENAYTQESVISFNNAVYFDISKNGKTQEQAVTDNLSKLRKLNIEFIKPERITSYEIGYKTLIKRKLFVDLSYYYSKYDDFQANLYTIQPLKGRVDDGTAVDDVLKGRTATFFLYTNAKNVVTSMGVAANFDYTLPKGYRVAASYTWASFDAGNDPDLVPGFNTPAHRTTFSIANNNVYKGFGFNITHRWNDAFLFESSFGEGNMPAFHNLGLQLSYKLPNIPLIIKAGGNNLANVDYLTAYGTAKIGSQYFIGLTYDPKASN